MKLMPHLLAGAFVLLGASLASAADTQSILSRIKLPQGFRIAVYAEVPEARSIANCGDNLIVSSRDGSIYAVRPDGSGGGKATRIASDLHSPNGVACHGDRLYVGLQDKVSSWPIAADGSIQRNGRKDLLDLPDKAHHGWRYTGIGPDGKLYVAIGSPCNICQPEGLEGSIIRMNTDGSDKETVASGVRNSVGFDWQPSTGTMFFTDNGADTMGDDTPPDELNEVRKVGDFYGFPYFGGTVRLKGYADKKPPREQTPPAHAFKAHVAALGMHFYRGAMFPAAFRGDVFVAQHGSWNRTEPDGANVVRVHFENGQPKSEEIFAQGWLQGSRKLGRPVDVKEFRDGSLAVSDDEAGLIYRISYGG
ncbi:Glucose/arabinose dehydrogenase, beta-propeller fold [Faunimonas pinastri]|uniref:Glucose/arabinose dehydrogenase, beta-propeller fold n=1 Tax=Faunimonas pinastri TaxID=1855383 RepID=A0A1H9JDI8_9HYPH|nr:PQQ-dependent sugar dehydrogenase [Faunimonas pinastri]SEQ84827.1 Glucose/arabinose dehydrogenase, beta-propeller fold [Faunimonas pinastri]